MPKAAVFSKIPSQTSVLRVQGLCFGHTGAVLLGGLSATLPPGVSLVVGNEGCGKTSLLRVLAGECLPQAGTAELLRSDPTHGTVLNLQSDAAAWRAAVFYADARDPAWDDQPVDAVLQCQHEHHAETWNADLLEDLIDAFALTEHRPKRMFMLSTGSRRKVLLAAAFASGAVLTLLDDPWAALDAPSRALLTELLAEAADHPSRAWLITGYEAPPGVPLAARWAL